MDNYSNTLQAYIWIAGLWDSLVLTAFVLHFHALSTSTGTQGMDKWTYVLDIVAFWLHIGTSGSLTLIMLILDAGLLCQVDLQFCITAHYNGS